MKLYLDTSAILAYYDKSSDFYSNCRKLFQFSDLELFSGLITVLEMESVIGRSLTSFTLEIDSKSNEIFNSLREIEKIPLITQYFIRRLDISIESASSIEYCEINQEKLDIFSTYNLALKLNRDLKLRTLDAIQIATAVEIRIYNKIDLEYFVTNDLVILECKKKLYNKSRILPVSTDELVGILNL